MLNPTVNLLAITCYLALFNLRSISSSRNDYDKSSAAGNFRHLTSMYTWFVDVKHKTPTKFKLGGGIDLNFAHQMNGKSHLDRVLRDDLSGTSETDPSATNNGLVIVGDVYLRKSPSRIPVMAVQPNKTDSLTLKQWLKLFISSQNGQRKYIQLNLHSSNVVEPTLQYLLAVRYDLKVPVIIHANIETEPHSFEETVDAYNFVQSATKLPQAIVSVGWAPLTGLNDEQEKYMKHNKRFSWRMIFDMLENVYEIGHPVIFRCRAHLASNSLHQLLWLTKIRPDFHLLLWSFDKDPIENWPTLALFRKYLPADQLFYDLSHEHSDMFFNNYEKLQKGVSLEDRLWKRHKWHVVQFANPTALLSTVVVSDEAVGFFGWPQAFLMSETVAKPGHRQSVKGKVLFVPKADYMDVNPVEITGLSIFLLDSVEDISSPALDGSGIRALIGSDGQISIENRLTNNGRTVKTNLHKSTNNVVYPKKSSSQLQLHECYGFHLVDSLTNVQLTVYPTTCSGSEVTEGSNDNGGYQRTITLDVPPPPGASKSRYVLVQKTGDSNIDCLVEDLYHKNKAPGASSYSMLLYSGNFASAILKKWHLFVFVTLFQRIIIFICSLS